MPTFDSFLRQTWTEARPRLAALADRPLVWLLPFYLAGLYAAWRVDDGQGARPLLGAAACAAASLAMLFFPQKISKYSIFLLIPATVALGWGLCALSLARPERPDHLANYMDGGRDEDPVILGGYVLEGSGGRPDQNYRLIIDARELIRPGDHGPEARIPVTGRARISVGGHLAVEEGDYARLPVILRPLAGFKNPGGYEAEKHWRAQGWRTGGFVKSPRLVTSWPPPDGNGLLARWRSRAAAFVEARVAGPASGPLSAMLVGRRGAVDEAGEEVFRALGLSHILSVSGLHLGVWYGLCFWVARVVLRRLAPALGGRGRLNLAAAGLALVPALFYAALVGPASPVLRSAVMIAAVVTALLVQRRADPWNILVGAAWIILLAEPYRLFTVSFQLSFVATAAMLAVFVPRPGTRPAPPPPADRWWRRPVDRELARDAARALLARLPGRSGAEPFPAGAPPPPKADPPGGQNSFFRNSLLAALAGTLGTAPLAVWHFGRLPLAGILANLVFTPLLSALVLIPGLIALALQPLSPALAAWPLAWAGGVLNGLWPVLDGLAGAAGPGLLLPAPGPWFMAAWFAAGWVWLRSARPARIRLGAAGLILALGLLPGLIRGTGEVGILRVTVLDVGQGTAIHLNLPDGRQMLVDGGGGYRFDPGESLVTPFLLRQGLGLARLDVAVLSHPDQDHLAGLATVAENFRPREVWSSDWAADHSRLYERFQKATRDAARIGPDELAAGRRFGPAEVRVLWPPDKAVPGPPLRGDEETNDLSMVLKVGWGEAGFLFTGDIGPQVERRLAAEYGAALRATVLVCPHHGGRKALTPEFLAAVRPAWVVFTAGRHNSYGLPHPETLARARAAGAMIRRTDLEGAAVFEVRERNGDVTFEARPPL